LEDSPDAVLHVEPSGIAMALIMAGVGDGFAVLGQCLVRVDLQMRPTAGAHDDRHDAGLTGGLKLQRDLQLVR
jgi:hypothetical protein